MTRQIVLFEDAQVENLYPLALNRPVYDLRCGITPLGDKVARAYPGAPLGYHVRPYLGALVKERKNTQAVNGGFAEAVLLVNGRVLYNDALAQAISLEGGDALYVCGETLVAARLSGAALCDLRWDAFIDASLFGGLPVHTVDAPLMTYPWDLVYANAKQIAVDYDALGCTGEKAGTIYEGVHIVNPGRVTVGPGAVVKPGVVIDAEKGPVWIDAEAVIYPQAVLEGPCYVGRGTWISMGAKIYEGVSIAAWCKIGGEVEESVIHACTNKRHDGFLGHSVLGEWVNIGADTNTSNLKNNYSDVSCVIQGRTVSSGRMFMGATIGDHTKLGINTMLNTGVVIGFSANVFGSDFPPKSIPSYVWGGAVGFAEYTIEKAIENAVKCVRRKEMVISPSEQQVFRDIFDMTRGEREPMV